MRTSVQAMPCAKYLKSGICGQSGISYARWVIFTKIITTPYDCLAMQAVRHLKASSPWSPQPPPPRPTTGGYLQPDATSARWLQVLRWRLLVCLHWRKPSSPTAKPSPVEAATRFPTASALSLSPPLVAVVAVAGGPAQATTVVAPAGAGFWLAPHAPTRVAWSSVWSQAPPAARAAMALGPVEPGAEPRDPMVAPRAPPQTDPHSSKPPAAPAGVQPAPTAARQPQVLRVSMATAATLGLFQAVTPAVPPATTGVAALSHFPRPST